MLESGECKSKALWHFLGRTPLQSGQANRKKWEFVPFCTGFGDLGMTLGTISTEEETTRCVKGAFSDGHNF
jgi:hypothetical protein